MFLGMLVSLGVLSPQGRFATQRSIEARRAFWARHPGLQPLRHQAHRRVRGLKGDTLVVRILALRVQFQREVPDDPRTTGDGTFILEPQEADNPLEYDPPHDKAYFEALLQGAQNYFLDNTYGVVKVEYVVKPDAPDSAYTLPHKMAYYGSWDFFGEGICRLMEDAIAVADQDPTVDFNDIDQNGIPDNQEGALPLLVIFHAGAPWQTDLAGDSPYDIPALTIPAGTFEYYLGVPYVLANEGTDTIWDATIMPEQLSQDGWRARLQATVVHELLHLIFYIPDLYDIYYRGAGVGAWDIQGTAAYLEDPGRGIPPGLIPVLSSSWAKEWMDWYLTNYVFGTGFIGDSMILEDPRDTFALYPMASRGRSPRTARVRAGLREYWYIENRLRDLDGDEDVGLVWQDSVVVGPENGEWDFLLPGDGVLIWHVDWAIIDSEEYYYMNAVRPMGLDLEEADGVQDLEEWGDHPEDTYGSPRDPWYVGNRTHFGPSSWPDTRTNRGDRTGISVDVLSPPGFKMEVAVSDSLLLAKFQAGDSTEGPAFLVPGDPDSDGRDELFVVRCGAPDSSVSSFTLRSRIYYVDTGVARIWSKTETYDLNDWSAPTRIVYGRPALGDLNGDGTPELVFGTAGGWLNALEASGAQALHHFLGQRLRSSPGLWDADRDGVLDAVVGHEGGHLLAISGSGDTLLDQYLGTSILAPPAQLGDTLVILGTDGVLRVEGSQLGEPVPYPTPSWPAVGDLDGDGTPELLALSGDGVLRAWHPDGSLLFSRETDHPPQGPLALGDLDRDGRLEVAFLAGNRLWAVNHLGALLSGYPIPVDTPAQGPIITDGALLVAQGGGIYAYDAQGHLLPGYPLWLEATGDLALVDWDGDGRLELAAADRLGNVFIYGLGDTLAPWPQAGHDALHTSYLAGSPYAPSGGEISPLQRVYFYPNPAHGRVRLRYLVPGPGQMVLELYTVSGMRLMAEAWNARGGAFEERELDISQLGPDVYLARVRYEGSVKILKLAVE